MADDTQLSSPVGTGDVISTDDLGTKKVQRVKVQYGVDGSATDASAANPLPVDQTNTSVADGGTLPAKGVQIGGTDGSVFQVMSTDSAGRPNVNVNGTVPVSGPLTDTQLRASAVPVSGTVTASGPLTDTQLRASAVPVTAVLTAGSAAIGKLAANSGVDIGDVDVTSSALPTGAATSAKQPALGTAGAASADVISVQGVASMTALKTDSSATTQPVSAASLPLPAGASTAAKQPALGTAGSASADVLSVQGVASMTALKVDGSGVTQPVSLAGTQSVNQAQVAGTTTDTNSGTKSAGTQRVVLATDQPALTNALKVDPSAVTSPVSLATAPALVASTANIGFVTPTPGTTGGWSPQMYAAQTTTVRTVKGTAGTFGGYATIYNPNATVAYVQVFDVASATTVTLGTTVPNVIIPVPATSAANCEMTNGINMALGIKLACTTTATGSTAPGTGLDMTVLFK